MYIVYDAKDPGHELATSGLAAPAGLLRHHGHPADPHRQALLRCGERTQRSVPGDRRRRPRRRQVGRQRQDPAALHGAAAQVPLPRAQHGTGESLDPEPHPSRWHAGPDHRGGRRCQLHGEPVRADQYSAQRPGRDALRHHHRLRGIPGRDLGVSEGGRGAERRRGRAPIPRSDCRSATCSCASTW